MSTTNPKPTFDEEEFTQNYPDYQGQIRAIETIPPEDSDTVPANRQLPNELAAKLDHELFTHQNQALEHLSNGDNVTIATSTSSGKTLVYALQIARNYLENLDTTALLIYPTKALSRDQERSLNDLYKKLGLDINVSVYDGDTPKNRRKRIRSESNVIITNFSGVNVYLSDHRLWDDFYNNTELITIDESHSYTGIHGMHAAWTIRRLRRILNHYGANPQFVLTSATIGNPTEHSKNLTGVNVKVVEEDGSPHGRRDIVFWNPPTIEQEEGYVQKQAGKEAADVLGFLAHIDYQTLMFTRSRKQTEINAKRATSTLEDFPRGSSRSILPYNGGHGKQTRRSVENRLKDGDLDGVVTTNALELGIDIGSVDATVLTGYPGTRQSFWQQIGRAGRGNSDALGIFVTRNDSIDNYILNNPEYILQNDNIESAVVDLQNNFVFSKHLLAASEELPLTRNDVDYFDPYRLKDAVEMWRQAGEMVGTLEGGVQYDGPPRPQRNISLYATSDTHFEVRGKNDLEVDIEPISKERAYREYHEGAITLHQGVQYEVIEFNEETRNPYVVLKQTNVPYHTRALSETYISDLDSERTKRLSEHVTAHWGYGTVEVIYDEFKKVNFGSGSSTFGESIDLPPITMETQLMWINVDDATTLRKNIQGNEDTMLVSGLHGIEHGIISLSPLELRMDKEDLGGLSQLHHPETGSPGTIFIYDGIDGGVGFSREIYENIDNLLLKTQELITNCDCEGTDGCPACIMEDSCGDSNKNLHTEMARKTITYMLEPNKFPNTIYDQPTL